MIDVVKTAKHNQRKCPQGHTVRRLYYRIGTTWRANEDKPGYYIKCPGSWTKIKWWWCPECERLIKDKDNSETEQ